MNAIVEHKPQKAALVAGGQARAIVPNDFDGCWRLANAVVAAGMAPKGLDTPEKATVAIMHGLEVGLTPMAALQSIAVVNGRPTIWGDGALALVRNSGLCEGIHEFVGGAEETMFATCRVKRRGEKEEISRTFTVAQAKKAGLWGKAGPWQQYPERMLAMRARAFALRDGFADILRGLGIAEEVTDHHDIPQHSATLVAPPPPDEPPVDERPVHPATPSEPVDDILAKASEWFAKCKDAEEVAEAWSFFESDQETLSPVDAERLRSLYYAAEDRVSA